MRRDYLVFQQSIECERLLVIGRIQADFVAHYRKFAGFIQRDVEQLRFDLAVVEQANRLFSMVPAIISKYPSPITRTQIGSFCPNA